MSAAYTTRLSTLIPAPLRSAIRARHKQWVLNAALSQFEQAASSATMTSELFERIIYGWSNAGWSCKEPFLRASIEEVEHGQGLIVECGSGITTLILGAVARRHGRRYLALEHDADWARRVQLNAAQRGLDNVGVVFAPLTSFGNADWYDISKAQIRETVDLVICDGPPSSTRGGRSGLMTAIFPQLSRDAVVLVDDSDRDAEWNMVRDWVERYDMTAERLASGGAMYCRVTFAKAAVTRVDRRTLDHDSAIDY